MPVGSATVAWGARVFLVGSVEMEESVACCLVKADKADKGGQVSPAVKVLRLRQASQV